MSKEHQNNSGLNSAYAGITAFAGIIEMGIGVYNLTKGEFQEGIQDIYIGGAALGISMNFYYTKYTN